MIQLTRSLPAKRAAASDWGSALNHSYNKLPGIVYYQTIHNILLPYEMSIFAGKVLKYSFAYSKQVKPH